VTHEAVVPFERSWVVLRRNATLDNPGGQPELGGAVFVQQVEPAWITFLNGSASRRGDGWRDGRLRIPLVRVVSLEQVEGPVH
jgi:hypothetical protein